MLKVIENGAAREEDDELLLLDEIARRRVSDELGEALFELTWQVVVLEQDLILERAMVALDLALGHRMIVLAPGMGHAVLLEPGSVVIRAGHRPRTPSPPARLSPCDLMLCRALRAVRH